MSKHQPKYRSIFISDVHLGLRASKKAALDRWLSEHDSHYLFLIGDIIDLWQMRSSLTWNKHDNQVIRRVLKIAKRARVVYVTGNHDEFLDEFDGMNFAGVEIRKDFVHHTAAGVPVLLMHGDELDQIVIKHKWLAIVGSYLYDVLIEVNEVNLWVRRRLGLKPWSLSKWLKHKAKEAVSMMGEFEDAAISRAFERHCEMVITGHIHKAKLKPPYANCGDWVESCSAIVEHHDGSFELLEDLNHA